MRTALALTLALSVAACSSNFIPQSRGRVSIILDGGAPAYVRDGVRYKHGFLGGGLVKAVRGHPQAEAAAREYKGRLGTGLLVTLLGSACVIGTAISAGVRTDWDDPDEGVPVELWATLGCTVAMFVGVGYAATAEPYRWDAINIFNEGFVTPMPGPYYPAPVGPPAGPAGPGGAVLLPPASPTTPAAVTLEMPR
jgi:hypothetical protein